MTGAEPSLAVKYCGTDLPDGAPRTLTAGPLSAVFDAGGIRYLRWHGAEVLRGVAFLARDDQWGTYSPAIGNLVVTEADGRFRVSYDAVCQDARQGLRYSAAIEGGSDGRLTFSVTAAPLTDFLTNRTAFVVLHPLAGVAGAPVDVMHTDGSAERTVFPQRISPGQPIFDIRSLRHEAAPGVFATVVMNGPRYEMEDHRNWMDASFKTYGCSLLDPWPYTLKQGETVEQSVSVTVVGTPASGAGRAGDGPVTLRLGGPAGRVPSIGLGVPMAEAQAAADRAALIAAAGPTHLICQIDGRRDGQAAAAGGFQALKQATGKPVTLEIVLPAQAAAMTEMAAIAANVRAGGLSPDAVVVTQMHDLKSFQPGTPRPWGPTYEEMAAAARLAFPGVPLGGGMLSYFTELNRKPPPPGVFDFITHTVCPIVHAPDDRSVLETLETLPHIFASCRALIGSSPYHLGPCSIPCRDNPYGSEVMPNPDNGRVCLSDADPRQRGLLAAAWSLGLAAAAARDSLDSIALGSATGPQGVIYRPADYAQPWFGTADAAVYPAFFTVAGLARLAGAECLASDVSDPGRLTALAVRAPSGLEIWLANLTPRALSVELPSLGAPGTITAIDENSFVDAVRSPAYLSAPRAGVPLPQRIDLLGYAVVRIAVAGNQ